MLEITDNVLVDLFNIKTIKVTILLEGQETRKEDMMVRAKVIYSSREKGNSSVSGSVVMWGYDTSSRP